MLDGSRVVDPLVQTLINARSRPSVTKIKFLNFRTRFPEGLILVVEGDDDKIFYSQWVSRVDSALEYEFFVSGGKREVRNLRNSLSKDLNDAVKNVAFFVDRDFDDLRGFDSSENVFMLDKYSIENYVVERSVVGDVLKAALPGDGNPHLREMICGVFEEDYANFLTCTKETNWRIFIARSFDIDVDGRLPDSLPKLASVTIGKVEPSGVSAKDIVAFEDVDENALDEISPLFADLNPADRYRGKFAFKFLRCWLECLATDYRSENPNLFPKTSVEHGRIKHEEFSLGSLARRSSLPTGFEDFVKSLATRH